MRRCSRWGIPRASATNAYPFVLNGSIHPRTPQRVYADSFDVSRAGCEEGWIVYAVPDGQEEESLEFAYEDTGSGGARYQSGHREEHVRFTWSLLGRI